jgi:predicted O-methyltransferase YrrM
MESPLPLRKLADMLSRSPFEILGSLHELAGEISFRRHMDRALLVSKGSLEALPLVYLVCRLGSPSIVVETGVASGISSAFVLLALAKNGRGQLYSIDLPNYDDSWALPGVCSSGRISRLPAINNCLPEGKSSGWAVPNSLRTRWTLAVGDTKDELPALLTRFGAIDLALHDSDHSHEAIVREGLLLWGRLRRGGLLVVDDIDISSGFSDLCERTAWRKGLTCGRLGVLQK